jgi:aldehyde dehydrogenase (NAD(P)+)
LTQGIGAVLGAGNITSIPLLDVLYELYAHNRVVALKLNPIQDRLLSVFSSVLAPLIQCGLVRIVTGGAEVGEYLVHHQRVSHVHLTGGVATHDAIMFGTGQGGARRKAANQPVLHKPITSELGGVSPTIVLPGVWSAADLKFQAEHIVTQRLHNGGYNCVASQVAVISSNWPQKDEFLAELREAYHQAPARPDYYPGSSYRVASAAAAYPHAERLGAYHERVFVRDLTPADYGPMARTEYFAPVLGVVEIPGVDLEFLSAAVSMANKDFAGTLGINFIATPRTLRALGKNFDQAIAELRYGTIAINAWTGVGFLTAAASWGAFPGCSVADVQSGIGVVHNAFLLAHPERTIVRGPFRPYPKPAWFVTNKTAGTTGKLLTEFAAAPSWRKLPRLFASALRG